MCGRFTMTTPAEAVARMFGVEIRSELTPRYNVAPTQESLCIRPDGEGGREAVMLRWGLIPFFAKDPSIGNRMINARSETAATKPSFRTALRRRRCLVSASGYVEWRREGSMKQPYHIQLEDGRPFGMAGLWERWRQDDGTALDSFTILTTSSNEATRDLHDRMPVIVDAEDHELWLDTGVESPQLLEPLMVPWEGSPMRITAISTRINKPVNDDPECLAKIV